MAAGAEYPAASKADVLASHHRGTYAARPSSLTLFDAGYWYLAEDEDGGSPYLWTGVAWERAAMSPGTDYIRATQAPYNCKADRVDLTDGAVSLGSPTVLSSASAAFKSADVGKAIAVECAGPGGTQSARTTSGANTLTLNWFTLTINNATGGTWSLIDAIAGTVAGIAYNVTAAALITALEAIYGAGKVGVTLSGTTYTVTLLSGAANQDTTKVTTNAASLTGPTNGGALTITTTTQCWSYGDVGKRIHIPGAGPAGGILDAVVGSIEPTNSNIAYLVDSTGANLNASATGTFTYYTRNWLRTTIQSVTNATTIVLASGLDSGVKVSLTALNVIYGTDDNAGLQSALDAAVAAGKWLDLPGNYLITSGISNFTPGGKYLIRMRGTVRAITTDNEVTSGNLRIGGAGSETAGLLRAKRVTLDGLDWGVPTAHYRGLKSTTSPLEVTNTKNAPGGVLISSANYISLHRCRMDTNFGLAYFFQSCRYGLVSHCEAWNSWADSFNLDNTNSVWNAEAYGDFTFIGCAGYNGGDDYFTINHKHAYSGGRPANVTWVGCRGYGMRNHALGRGFNILGGTNITISGCESYKSNGPGLQLNTSGPTNASVSATITTPGTGAQVDFASAPANVTAGAAGVTTTTQMQLFNGTTGQTWIGDVTAVGNSGKTLTLTARSDQAATCPFTGVNYVQWGATSDGGRFGSGGINRANITGFTTDTSCLDLAGDATTSAAVLLKGGPCTTLEIRDVRIRGLIVRNALQAGIMCIDALSSTSDVPSARSQIVRDIDIEGFYIDGTGYSSLTAARPWPGVYIQVGQNISFRNGVIKDTDDHACLIANGNVGGRLSLINIEGRDIARSYTNGAPLANAFDPGTSTAYLGYFENLFLTNPAGTAGGTQYVATNVFGQPPTASTIRGINSDITGQNLLVESAARYSIVVSPVMYRGKGSPESVVTAGVGAIYERSDGAAGSSLYVKESGTGNTGWIAYGSPGGQSAPPLDLITGHDPVAAGAAVVWPSAFRCQFMRIRGNGSITQIGFIPGVLSGNCLVAVYANTGTGDAAAPTGAPLAASVSTAMSGLTINIRNFLAFNGGTTVAVTHMNHWLMLAIDNTTATAQRIALVQADAGKGLTRQQDQGSLAAPTVSGSNPSAFGAMLWAK